MAEPLCPDTPSVSAESCAPDLSPGMHWLLALNLIAAWRGSGGVHRQALVAQRLVELADEGGASAVERAALGLTDIAGTLLELYARCAARRRARRGHRACSRQVRLGIGQPGRGQGAASGPAVFGPAPAHAGAGTTQRGMS